MMEKTVLIRWAPIHLIVVASLVSLPWTASANDGTPPWIFELVQQGDGVEITLAIVSNGEPGMADSYTLTRTGPEGNATVVEDRVFTADDAELTQGECRGGGSGDVVCTTQPEECIDCNDDGTPECDDPDGENWCDTVNYIHIVDGCVPPGQAEYRLHADGWDSNDDTETITVDDVDQDCSDGDDSSGGCSASGSSPSNPALIVSLLMLALGLAATRFGSTRRR